MALMRSLTSAVAVLAKRKRLQISHDERMIITAQDTPVPCASCSDET